MKTLILAAIRCSLSFTAVAALSVAYPARANLITNGGFEDGFFGWSHSGTVGLSGNAHSGNQAASFGSPQRFRRPKRDDAGHVLRCRLLVGDQHIRPKGRYQPDRVR